MTDKTCNYYQESQIDQFVRSCDARNLHPSDCQEWKFCPKCGNKVRFRINRELPQELKNSHLRRY